MFGPVKVGFGEYLGRFYAGLVATSAPLQAYSARGLAKSIVWCPGRMVDQAEAMLAAWQEHANDGEATTPAPLPVLLVAMGSNYSPVTNSAPQLAETLPIILADDAKQRLFGLKTVMAALPMQVVVMAAEQPTALALAAQLGLYMRQPANRRFTAAYTFAGLSYDWPVVLAESGVAFKTVTHDYHNLTVIAVDFVLQATVPLYDAPTADNPNRADDGVPGTDDPAGYLRVAQVNTVEQPPSV
jgi:hypothetical protein